jgi:hypothetical protein
MIQKRRREARLLTAVGLLLLVAALVISNLMTGVDPERVPVYILGAYVALIIGFIVFNAGLQGVAKWSRRPRRDEVIDNHLKRLNDRFTIVHYAMLGGKLFDHFVVHPGGVTVLVARDSFGPISFSQGRWRKRANPLARLFNLSGPAVGNPHAEAATTAGELQEYLHGQGLTVAVDSLIVFVNPRVVLTVDESPIPVVRVEELAGPLRERAASNALQGSQRLQAVKLVQGALKATEPAPPPDAKSRRRGSPTTARPRRSGQ